MGLPIWLGPFLFLGCCALGLARPSPLFPKPEHSREVTDSNANRVTIPVPLRGVVAWLPDYLPMTHAPEMIWQAGAPKNRAGFGRSLLGRIYPGIYENDRLWGYPSDIESKIAKGEEGIIYLSGGDDRFGLTHFGSFPSVHLLTKTQWQADVIFAKTRDTNAVLGHEIHAETLIAAYKQAFADLAQDLEPKTLASEPSLIGMVAPGDNWSRLTAENDAEVETGTSDAAKGWLALGREQDAERVLAMNPDIIIMHVGNADRFFRDPRWQALRAVQTRRVYDNAAINTYTFDIDNVPLAARWTAEIAHPERLQPKLRELMRDHYAKAYGYRLSDDDIDDLLNVNGNKLSAGYARFGRDNGITSGQNEASQ